MTDETHDPARQSWVASANDHADFPIQNLPIGVFSVDGGEPRIGVAIGDDILDVRGLAEAGLLDDRWLAPLMRPTLNEWFGHGPAEARALRRLLSDLLSAEAQRSAVEPHLVAQDAATMHLPCAIGDYTDFYVGIHHAMNVGKQFRPDQPLLPNYKHVPIGYHGRASSVRVSGEAGHPAQGAAQAPRSRSARIWPFAAARLRARTRHVHRPRQCAGLADRDRRGGAAYRGLLPAQRLVGARPAGVGISAARAVPRQEFPDQHFAVGDQPRSAGAVSPRHPRSPRRRPRALALPQQRRRPRHRAGSALRSPPPC